MQYSRHDQGGMPPQRTGRRTAVKEVIRPLKQGVDHVDGSYRLHDLGRPSDGREELAEMRDGECAESADGKDQLPSPSPEWFRFGFMFPSLSFVSLIREWPARWEKKDTPHAGPRRPG